MKKATKKHTTHDKKADPVKMPNPPGDTVKFDLTKQTPRMADESKPLDEAVVPKAQEIGSPERNCGRSDCGHSGAMHYGSKDRWCNTRGCLCEEFL